MRKILLLIGILILGMEASAYAAALDAPHNQTNLFACADCHNFGSLPVDDACLSCHINNTGGGYSKTNAPKMLTHSSANTSTKYGTWEKLCKDCHEPHTQNQREFYGSETYLVTGTITKATRNTAANTVTYDYNGITALKPEWADFTKWGKKSANASNNERGLILFPNIANLALSAEIISATGSAITVRGYPGTVTVPSTFALLYGQYMAVSVKAPSGSRGVQFFNNTGPKSFAYDESGTGTDLTPNGICQVCHTQTSAWRADGTLSGVGVHAGLNGANCVSCHKHEAGFAADCGSCHGFPPINATAGGPNGLVNSPAPTDSATAGAHNKHANTLGLDCNDCHYNSKGSGPTHNDGTIQAVTMGFSLFSGAVQGGKYDGQAGVDYNATVTSPVTTVSNTGTKECSNIYCHSSGQASGGGALTLNTADYKKPVWSGSVVCGECHKSDGVQGTMTYMDSGSHLPHINVTINKQCSECHKNAGDGTVKHVNNLIEVAFDADPFSNTSSYSQSPNTPGNGYGSCSTVYCHSSAQGNGGFVAGEYKSPVWGGSALGCTDCHANASMATGSHTQHLNVFGVDCTNCHNNAGPFTAKHADRNIDIAFNGLIGGTGTYSQNPNPPGNGYGSCSTTYCHGTASPAWGNNTATTTCEKCHGSANTAQTSGLFKDTAGSTTSGKAVNHVSHLASTHNYTNDIACSQCHAVPVSVNAAGHIDSALPAEVNPSLGFGGGSCSTTYCHGAAMPKGTTEGANRTPLWTDTGYLNGDPNHDCAQCHGYPPLAIAAHTGMGPTTCINCHDKVNASGTGFTDPSTHINGALEGGGDNCLDCHSSLSATHTKHADAATVLAGKTISAVDYGQASWFYGVTYVSGAPKYSCGYCHPNTPGTHMNGVKDLNFDPNEAGMPGGTVKGLNGSPAVFTRTSGVSVTCSSVYCHSAGYNDGTGYIYQTTPDWYGGAFAGDKCSNCHGNSPNTGGKAGSLSHYNPDAMGMGVVGGHFVGIHYNNVFTGTSGLTKDASGKQNAHGNPLTSTTINCQTCHNVTVTVSGNDLNAICATCHGAGALKGTMVIAPAATTHINGQADVSFDSSVVNSKAQVRDNITTVPELNNSWTRNNGYKAATSYDGAKTSASFDAGTKTCSSVACHNGNTAQWGAPNVTCNSCHTSLP